MQCSAEPMRACASEQWPLLTDEGEGEGEGRRWQGVEDAPPAWTSTAAGVLAVQRRADRQRDRAAGSGRHVNASASGLLPRQHSETCMPSCRL